MTDTPASARDRLTRFLIRDAGVRGVHVRVDEAWRQIRAREDYPVGAMLLLGQATAAAALFTGHAKVDGRLSVQMRGSGSIRTLFAECTAAATVRGIVQLADGVGVHESLGLGDLGSDGVLAITIENRSSGGRDPMRYQGLVPLEASRLDHAFEDYFRQSEQLPTRILLVASETVAAGLMVQKLPGDEGDVDGWNRVGSLFETLREDELLGLPGSDVLHRLFHEDGVETLAGRDVAFACSCSQERVESMLVALGHDEASQALQDGVATIRCEFCGQTYRFDQPGIDRLFAAPRPGVDSPDRLQ